MRPVRLLAATAAIVAAVATAPLSPAQAQDQVSGVSLTPGVVEHQLPSRDVDLSFTVSNNEPGPMTIALSVAELSQTLDGSFAYGAPSPLTVRPAELLLGPRQSGKVQVSGAIPAGAPALYAGVLAEPRPAAVAGGEVRIRTRVAGLLLLTAPGEHRRGVEVEDVTLTPTSEERTHRVAAVLRNTGEVHVRPHGVVEISLPDGPALGTAQLTGAVLLPGSARRLDGGLWTAPPEDPAEVQMDVWVSDPDATGGRRVTLGDVGPEAPPVQSGQGLGELGDDDGAGPGRQVWAILVALILVLLMSALLLRERGRRASGGLPA